METQSTEKEYSFIFTQWHYDKCHCRILQFGLKVNFYIYAPKVEWEIFLYMVEGHPNQKLTHGASRGRDVPRLVDPLQWSNYIIFNYGLNFEYHCNGWIILYGGWHLFILPKF